MSLQRYFVVLSFGTIQIGAWQLMRNPSISKKDFYQTQPTRRPRIFRFHDFAGFIPATLHSGHSLTGFYRYFQYRQGQWCGFLPRQATDCSQSTKVILPLSNHVSSYYRAPVSVLIGWEGPGSQHQ
jgi:hypothetical protein